MKKYLLTIAEVLLAAVMLSSCVSDVEGTLQDISGGLENDYMDYLADHDKYPQSVLDILDLMLESYVSGTATPSITTITPVIIPPDSPDHHGSGNRQPDFSGGARKPYTRIPQKPRYSDNLRGRRHMVYRRGAL